VLRKNLHANAYRIQPRKENHVLKTRNEVMGQVLLECHLCKIIPFQSVFKLRENAFGFASLFRKLHRWRHCVGFGGCGFPVTALKLLFDDNAFVLLNVSDPA